MMFPIRCILVLGRGAASGLAVFLVLWLQAVPPDSAERRTLGLGLGPISKTERDALRTLRLARTALWIAPDLAVEMIARQGQGRVTRAEVETALAEVADGKAAPPGTGVAETFRRISGAKFVKPPGAGG